MVLKTGKLDWMTMSQLLGKLPVKDPDVVLGPSQGEDAGVVRLGDGFMVTHSDPITTGVEHAGYLAVHVAANDLAVRGVHPRWFLPTILVSPELNMEELEKIFTDIGRALGEINGVVVGGHTEVTPGLQRTIIVMTAIGYTNGRVVLTRDARLGDVVVVVGKIGGEGAGVLAWDWEEKLLEKNVPVEFIEIAKSYMYNISVVKVALGLRNIVNAMHDVTEGGLIQALRELAVASRKKVVVDASRIRLDPVVDRIVSSLGLDPLRILSSGCIIATLPESRLKTAEKVVAESGKEFNIIGWVEDSEKPEVLLRKGSETVSIDSDIVDEIYKVWELF
ncbi:MAG: AIR synthase-related protein [Thermosphaera sp.]